MALSRWDPVWFDVPHNWPARVRRWFDSEAMADGWMRIEEREDTDALVVRAELPGLDPAKDIDVEVIDAAVRISAKRHEHPQGLGSGTFRSEFHYGVFVRSVPIPTGAAPETVTATYADGILEVRIPWPAEEADQPQATKITVQRA